MNRARTSMIVMGASAGGGLPMNTILSTLGRDFPAPIAIVQHIHKSANEHHLQQLDLNCALSVREAYDKEPIQLGSVIFAPADYHLQIEVDKTYALSVDELVNFARPSIDVLFETAALAFGSDTIGVILSGANNDGSHGLKTIKDHGGVAIVQDPETAEVPTMPANAIACADVDIILPAEEIGEYLLSNVRRDCAHA